jgi:hypothetical protein
MARSDITLFRQGGVIADDNQRAGALYRASNPRPMMADEERLLAKARRLAGLVECRDCGGLTLSETGRCWSCRAKHVRTIV